MSMKNSSDTIGNRSRDFPTCRAVPQPTALRGALITVVSDLNINKTNNKSTFKEEGNSKLDTGFFFLKRIES